jgi:site-specific recombinase XerD
MFSEVETLYVSLKSGVSIETIAEMLGQASTAVTKHYSDSFDQEQIHEINNFLS